MKTTATLEIGTQAIAPETFATAVRDNARLTLGDGVPGSLAAARVVVERSAAAGAPVYGLTTGLGAGVDTRLASTELAVFQRQAVLARAVGVGAPMAAEDVRATMAARLVGLALAGSGISPGVVDAYLAAYNAGLLPVVPSIGSIGAADLAPLAHVAAVLIGEGEAWQDGRRVSGRAALEALALAPVTLGPKDGLALINANAASVGPAALLLHDLAHLEEWLLRAAALSLEAFGGNLSPIDARLVMRRAAPGQAEASARLARLLEGSTLWRPGAARRLQDPLSLRCLAPLHGALAFQRGQAERCVAIELAGAGDNPLVLVAADEILSNAGFDVTAMTIALEALGLALAHCAATAVRRVGQLLHAEASGLPRFLAAGGRTQTGFATVQKTLSALEGEIRHLAMPATLGTIPVADGIEDHAGLAPYVVQKTRRIANRLWRIAAIELMAAAQAIELREPSPALGPPMRDVYAQTRAAAAKLDDTRAPGPEIDRLARAIGGVALRDD